MNLLQLSGKGSFRNLATNINNNRLGSIDFYKLMKGAVSLMPPSPELSNTLFPAEEFKLYDPKDQKMLKTTTLCFKLYG